MFKKKAHFFGGVLTAETDYLILEYTVNANDTITLPTFSSGNYNFKVADWGDGASSTQITTYNDSEINHTYTSGGVYKVKINGIFSQIRFNGTNPSRSKLTDVTQWGVNAFNYIEFKGCANLQTITATDAPVFNSGTSLKYLFYSTSISYVNNIENWEISNVVSLDYSFNSCDFNQSLQNWNLINLISANQTFKNNSIFNKPIFTASGNLTNTNELFRGTTSFNQDISNLNYSNVTVFGFFLLGVTLSTANYDAFLISLSGQNVQQNITIHCGNSKYTLGGAADAARNTLINTYGWTITDGGGI